MIIALVDEAVNAGARRKVACGELGLDVRTLERWSGEAAEDQRRAAKGPPVNKLTRKERDEVLRIVNSPRYRDLSPNQIVPLLADEEGRYVASERTIYRILNEEDLLHHRSRAKPPMRRKPLEHNATGPNQVWSWDITYLKSPIAGKFFYLYLFVDVWSRKIVGWEVHEEESAEHAALLFETICQLSGIDPSGLVLHADNGGPMKGATMVATLERLGVLTSFSRPRVSDDNPYSEALFRTLKYRPEYPTKPFVDVEAARAWVSSFVGWYNTEHLHSGIRFVTPNDRHEGRDVEVLARRIAVYEAAQGAHPERFKNGTRDWSRIEEVRLNPGRAPRSSSATTSRAGGGGVGAQPEGAGDPAACRNSREPPTGGLVLPETTPSMSPGRSKQRARCASKSQTRPAAA
jgi:putative transposase